MRNDASRGWRMVLGRAASGGHAGGVFRTLAAIGLAASLGGCGPDQSDAKAKTPRAATVPVVTAHVEEKAVDIEARAIGSVEPIQKVSIRSQVGGILTKIAFREGEDVREGQLLFEIDSRPLESDLRRAEATLGRDQAQLQNAERQVKRYEELAQRDFVARQQYEDVRTAAEVMTATVKVDAEAVANARLLLDYATIRAPIVGRTGALMNHLGDVIKANDLPLVVINQLQPILVRFAVPAERIPDIKDAGGTNLLVRVWTSGERRKEHRGVLCFVDNAVDPDTGTILLKGQFENADAALWPGQFLDVALVMRTEPHALTLPSEAVQTGQSGLFVFVVKPDMTVEKRTVEVERTLDGTTVIGKGLSAGEPVVIDGQLRLVSGSRVEVRSEAKTPGGTK